MREMREGDGRTRPDRVETCGKGVRACGLNYTCYIASSIRQTNGLANLNYCLVYQLLISDHIYEYEYEFIVTICTLQDNRT